MKKNILIVLSAIAIILIGLVYAFQSSPQAQPAVQPTVSDEKNTSYIVEGQKVALVGGVSEVPVAPGSASKTITRYFGNEVRTDLNGDGREDVVFLLTQESGGSGTFYYVVAALNTETGYVGSQALFLGDRIAPQTTEKGNGNIVVVNYAERAPNDAFTASPSIGKSIRLLLDPATMQFGEVATDFEGEADPSRMTLGMKKWVWVSTLMNDGKEILPKKKDAFTLTFNADKSFSLSTDCNTAGGTYTPDGSRITFGPMFSTLMYCEGAQEGEFLRMVGDSTSYHFTSKGELVLDIKFDSGSVIFR